MNDLILDEFVGSTEKADEMTKNWP